MMILETDADSEYQTYGLNEVLLLVKAPVPSGLCSLMVFFSPFSMKVEKKKKKSWLCKITYMDQQVPGYIHLCAAKRNTNLISCSFMGHSSISSPSLCFEYHGEVRRTSGVVDPGRHGYGGMCVYFMLGFDSISCPAIALLSCNFHGVFVDQH